MGKMTLKLPSWINKEEAENELLKNLKIKAQLKMEFYRSKMLPFERRYNISLEEFKKRFNSKAEEKFEEWDDFIEWEASFNSYNEWKQRFEEIECSVK
ncbi:MAG TPA: hypothetical protein ENN22_14985 [bacterium]|nr:hypothetical protein [bacterium]